MSPDFMREKPQEPREASDYYASTMRVARVVGVGAMAAYVGLMGARITGEHFAKPNSFADVPAHISNFASSLIISESLAFLPLVTYGGFSRFPSRRRILAYGGMAATTMSLANVPCEVEPIASHIYVGTADTNDLLYGLAGSTLGAALIVAESMRRLPSGQDVHIDTTGDSSPTHIPQLHQYMQKPNSPEL